MIAFISSDVGQYVYWNCLLTRLWRHKFSNWPYLSNQVVFVQDQKIMRKFEISWGQKELLKWNKKHFPLFSKGFQLSEIISDLFLFLLSFLFSIGIHSNQGLRATKRQEITRKRSTKRLQHTGNEPTVNRCLLIQELKPFRL